MEEVGGGGDGRCEREGGEMGDVREGGESGEGRRRDGEGGRRMVREGGREKINTNTPQVAPSLPMFPPGKWWSFH